MSLSLSTLVMAMVIIMLIVMAMVTRWRCTPWDPLTPPLLLSSGKKQGYHQKLGSLYLKGKNGYTHSVDLIVFAFFLAKNAKILEVFGNCRNLN